MVKKSNIHIRVDSNIKEEAIQLFNELGLDLTTAINLFLNQSIKEKGIPFKIKIYNTETQKAIEDYDSKNNLTSYDSVDSLINDVVNEDLQDSYNK